MSREQKISINLDQPYMKPSELKIVKLILDERGEDGKYVATNAEEVYTRLNMNYTTYYKAIKKLISFGIIEIIMGAGQKRIYRIGNMDILKIHAGPLMVFQEKEKKQPSLEKSYV